MVGGRPQFAAYKLACHVLPTVLCQIVCLQYLSMVSLQGFTGLLYRLFLLYGSQMPGYLQKEPCHLPEETGVQLLCAASYDIWCRDLDTDQTSTEQTCTVYIGLYTCQNKDFLPSFNTPFSRPLTENSCSFLNCFSESCRHLILPRFITIYPSKIC